MCVARVLTNMLCYTYAKYGINVFFGPNTYKLHKDIDYIIENLEKKKKGELEEPLLEGESRGCSHGGERLGSHTN